MDATKAYIEIDEDGVALVVRTTRTQFRFMLDPDVAEKLYDSTRASIGPWLHERDAALASGWDSLDAQNLWPGPITDPKHPDHHDVMSGLSDDRDVG